MTPRRFGTVSGLMCFVTLLFGSPLSAQTPIQGPHNGPVSPSLYVWRMTPTADYERWYKAMEKCTGMKGAYKRIDWLMVEAPWLQGQRRTHGSWQGSDNGKARITVNAEEWTDSMLVMHEALHDILWRNDFVPPPLPDWASDTDSIEAKHPKPFFGRCAKTYYDDPTPA
jgi:hypothetical protein